MAANQVYHHEDNFNTNVNADEKTRLLGRQKKSLPNLSSGYVSISCKEQDSKECSFRSISSVDSLEEEFCREETSASHSFILTLVEKVTQDTKSSLFLTIVTILPIIQGSAVLSAPYAFLVGGKAFLPAGLAVCLLATVCSKLLIECLYEVSPRSQIRKRVYNKYEDLAFACWGHTGKKLLKVFSILYFAMNNVVNMVLLFKILDNLSNEHTLLPNVLGCLFVLLFLPILFGVRTYSFFAYFGLAGTISVVVACIASIVVFVENSTQWKRNFDVMATIDLQRFPLAISIIMYTLVVAPTLPIIEGTMSDRTQSTSAIYISFGTSSLFKAVFGVMGFLTFGMATKELIATNICDISTPSRYILSTMLLVYAFCNSSYIAFVMMDMIDEFFINSVSRELAPGQKYRTPWMIFSRPICLAILAVTALVMPFFALVSGVVGAICGSFLAFIAPVYFHVKLKWYELSFGRKLCECLLLVANILLGAVSTYSSMNELIFAIKTHHNL